MAESSSQKVRVYNFDPDAQAQMWERLGPNKAISRMSGMLRLATFLGDELVIDGNDLLDGVYFLALGPKGVAEQLGVFSHEPLPLTVLCQPGIRDVRFQQGTSYRRRPNNSSMLRFRSSAPVLTGTRPLR